MVAVRGSEVSLSQQMHGSLDTRYSTRMPHAVCRARELQQSRYQSAVCLLT